LRVKTRIGISVLVSDSLGYCLTAGAGFYLTATDPKWRKHYNMYDLVVKELPAVLKEADLGLDTSRMSIMGHSMGGTFTADKSAHSRSWSSIALPQELGSVQVRICFRTRLQPLHDTLGQKGIRKLHQPHNPIDATSRVG
jgi:hypothetical protein